MSTQLAILICSVGIAGLFSLDRDKSTRNSKALWLPVIWVWIAGSRPLSSWLGSGPSLSQGVMAATIDGSPTDAAIFAALLAAGIGVLFSRKIKTGAFLRASWPITIYFLYCLISILWSPIPSPAFKRWTKDVGDLVMVLIIVTDAQPVAALRRFFSRVGFILLPFSVLLIRYSPLGRGYTIDGGHMNTGVTTNKNSLGVIVFLVSLGALWNVWMLFMDKEAPNRGRRLLAQCTLLTFGIVLLQMSHSATSIACFAFGGGLMLITNLRAFRNRPARVHAFCLSIIVAGGLLMLFGGKSVVTSALGRNSDLSGRTYIWAAVIAAAENPIIGSGYESFWNANVEKVNRSLAQAGFLDMSNLVTAHNGYLEAYLDLGWVGVFLIALILISGYLRSSKAFQRDPGLGSLMLAYVTTSTFYSITEVGFRVLAPSWIFLLLAVVSASGVVSGELGGKAAEILIQPADNRNSQGAPQKIVRTDPFFQFRDQEILRNRRSVLQVGSGEAKRR